MQKKKGGAHVGFILSFVIFVTFLIFLYSMIIEPTKTNQNKQYLLGSLKINLIKNISSDLMTSTITTESASQKCVKLEDLINDLGINSKIIIKNKLGIIQSGSYVVLTNNLEIVRDNTNDNFFKIYYSKNFQGLSNVGQNPCNKRNYTKGLVRINKYVFEPNVINLINEYEDNYGALKTKLEIPEGNDFGFSFEYSNRTIIKPKEEIPSVSVYTKEVQIIYFNKNAEVLPGKLNIEIW